MVHGVIRGQMVIQLVQRLILLLLDIALSLGVVPVFVFVRLLKLSQRVVSSDLMRVARLASLRSMLVLVLFHFETKWSVCGT